MTSERLAENDLRALADALTVTYTLVPDAVLQGSPAIQKTPCPTTATIITLTRTVMLLRLILHEIKGSLHGFLHRFHITTLDPEHSGFTRLFV
ncbi:hypothetical protein BJN43_28065 [Escherichia coli]|nr:hypothetical protein BJN43_28065 [Escherichia coli]